MNAQHADIFLPERGGLVIQLLEDMARWALARVKQAKQHRLAGGRGIGGEIHAGQIGQRTAFERGAAAAGDKSDEERRLITMLVSPASTVACA